MIKPCAAITIQALKARRKEQPCTTLYVGPQQQRLNTADLTPEDGGIVGRASAGHKDFQASRSTGVRSIPGRHTSPVRLGATVARWQTACIKWLTLFESRSARRYATN